MTCREFSRRSSVFQSGNTIFEVWNEMLKKSIFYLTHSDLSFDVSMRFTGLKNNLDYWFQ